MCCCLVAHTILYCYYFSNYNLLDALQFCIILHAGVDDNETIKIYRNGGADPEGGQPGDLYVTIKVNAFKLLCYMYK